MRLEVSSSHEVRCPAFSALHSMDRAGLLRATCRNVTRSVMVAYAVVWKLGL